MAETRDRAYVLQARLLERAKGYSGVIRDDHNKAVLHTMLDTFAAMIVYARRSEHVSAHERELAEEFVREFAGTFGLAISDERLAELGGNVH